MKNIKIAMLLLGFIGEINRVYASSNQESIKITSQELLGVGNKHKRIEKSHPKLLAKKSCITGINVIPIEKRLMRTEQEHEKDLALCIKLGSNATKYCEQVDLFGKEINEGRGDDLTPSAFCIGLAASAKKKKPRRLDVITNQELSNKHELKTKRVVRTAAEYAADLALCIKLGSDAKIYQDQRVVFAREIREGRGESLTPSAFRLGSIWKAKEDSVMQARKLDKVTKNAALSLVRLQGVIPIDPSQKLQNKKAWQSLLETLHMVEEV